MSSKPHVTLLGGSACAPNIAILYLGASRLPVFRVGSDAFSRMSLECKRHLLLPGGAAHLLGAAIPSPLTLPPAGAVMPGSRTRGSGLPADLRWMMTLGRKTPLLLSAVEIWGLASQEHCPPDSDSRPPWFVSSKISFSSG